LEPYGDLVEELRCQGFTCRDIVALLAEKCQFNTSKSLVNRFVRARARRRRNAARQLSREAAVSTPVVSKSAVTRSSERPTDDEVWQRIAAVKAKKPANTSPTNDFYFDPNEPLRLIDPGKRDSHD
jgi:hypothetical protein